MPSLTPNTNVEASVAFDVVKPGTYRMRIDSVDEFTAQSGNTCWRIRFVYVDPTSLEKLDGTGLANNPGSLLDSGFVVIPTEKQGKLRGLVEAVGLTWAEMTDSDVLLGKEVDVKVGTEEYNGETVNRTKRYLAVQV